MATVLSTGQGRGDLMSENYIELSGLQTETRDILWYNPSPSSSFSYQTISLDLSEYQSIIVEYSPKANAGGDNYKYNSVPIDIGDVALIWFVAMVPDGDYGGRNVTVASDGVSFGNGYNHSSSSSNDCCVPTRIYGIKR